jgi:hypothetical protein
MHNILQAAKHPAVSKLLIMFTASLLNDRLCKVEQRSSAWYVGTAPLALVLLLWDWNHRRSSTDSTPHPPARGSN